MIVNDNAKRTRIVYLDKLRTIAILLIVLDHAVLIGYKFLYDSFAENWGSMFDLSRVLRIFLWEASRLGVPLFLMITGALILNKDFEESNSIKRFYKNNLLPLVIINEIWVLIHFVIATVLRSIPYIYAQDSFQILNFKELIYSILMIKRSPYPNMWYLPTIIGLYVFLPFLSVVLKKYWIVIKFIVFFQIILLFACNDIGYIFGLLNIDFDTTTIIDLDFTGGVYGTYIIVGFVLANELCLLKKTKTTILVLSGISIIIIDMILCMLKFDTNIFISPFSRNNSVLQLLLCSIIFELVRRSNDKQLCKISRVLSDFSFPIYLIHYPVMLVVNYLLSIIIIQPATMKVLLLYIFTIIICCSFCKIIPNNRLLKKYVFHMK